MKRVGGLHQEVCTLENVELADSKARKNKKKKYGIQKHDKNKDSENQVLVDSLKNLTYKTSEYSTFTIYEPKERLIFRLPYYPDRICHHAIMNILEPIWDKVFIDQTYSCIKGRGIHKLVDDLQKVLKKDVEGTTYCLKIDIKKFYPSIDHSVLKRIIRRKIKDKELLVILDEIIDSSDGVPIGNYLSQYFANLVLAYFDHWVKEELKVKYYFRYADDMVLLSNDKKFLRNVLLAIKLYLKHELNLKIKDNYQIFPVDKRGIDYVGYVFKHGFTLLRKSIKTKMKRFVTRFNNGKYTLDFFKLKMNSYFGWMKHCNSKKLLQNIEKSTNIHYSNFKGKESLISNFYGKKVNIVEVVPYSTYYKIHFKYNGKTYSTKSQSSALYCNLITNKDMWNNYKINKYVYRKKNRNYCRT
jgi:hypothetical protein